VVVWAVAGRIKAKARRMRVAFIVQGISVEERETSKSDFTMATG
jgi:hypothetical protein